MKLLPLALLPLITGLTLPAQAGELQWRKTGCNIMILGQEGIAKTGTCTAGFGYDMALRAVKFGGAKPFYLEVGQNAYFHPLVGDPEFEFNQCVLTEGQVNTYMVCTTQDQNQLGIVGD